MIEISKTTFFKLLFCSFKVFGIATMSFCETFDKNNAQYRCWFAYSKIGMIYNLCLLAYVIVSNYFSIMYLYNYEVPNASKFDKILDESEDIWTLLTVIVIWLTFIIQQDKITLIINEIRQIRESTRILRARNNEIDVKEVALIFLVIGIIWCTKVSTISMYGYKYVLSVLCVNFCNFSMTSTMLQYSFILIILKQIFNFINDDFSEAFKDLISLRIENRDCLKFSNFIQIQRLYVRSTEISQEISNFYALPILMCIANIFYACISSSYYIAQPIVLRKSWLPFRYFIHLLSYGMLHLALLIILTRSVTATITEVIITNFHIEC